jgi:hypothetical protein
MKNQTAVDEHVKRLIDQHVELLKEQDKWFTYYSVYGMGKNAELRVKIGKKLYRVMDRGRVKYEGTSERQAVETYFKVSGVKP